MFVRVNRRYAHTGIHGRVVHGVGRDIVSGVYRQGERLPNEAEFIARFNGSRTAIREAFRVLSAKGLLEAKQRAGTRVRAREFWHMWDPDVLAWHPVKTLNVQMVQQLLEIRALVEPEAARLITDRSDKIAKIQELEKLCRTMEYAWEDRDVAKVHELETGFHLALLENCGNEFLIRSSEAVRLILDYCHLVQLAQAGNYSGAARWYRLIVEKIKYGDSANAANAVRSLIIRDQELLRSRGYALSHRQSAVA